MKAPKYTATLVKRETTYVAADGSILVFQPQFTERISDALENAHKFMMVELYTKVGKISANTKKELERLAYETGVFFDEVYIHQNLQSSKR